MTEQAEQFSRETTLYNNPHQIVIRKTADILDNLESDRTEWLVDSGSAREFLGSKTVPFVRAARENFHTLKTQLTTDDLIDVDSLAKRIPYRPINPATGKLLYLPTPTEPIGFTLVILAHMSKSARDIPGFTPPETPAEIMDYLEGLEKNILGVALDKVNPAQVAEEPSYQRMKRFFIQGRRIPIKMPETERERQARIDHEIEKLFGSTN